MTLIAAATYGNHAEIITDSLSYTGTAAQLAQATKHVALSHLDAVVLASGDQEFVSRVQVEMLTGSSDTPTFDALVDEAPELLNHAWNADPHDLSSCLVVLVGWSTSQRRFTAHRFASDDEFGENQERRLAVWPTPWCYRPDDLEVHRFRRFFADSVADIDSIIDTWQTRPRAPKPTSIDQWIALAAEVRHSRALTPMNRVLVGGHVTHLRLERGALVAQRIHEYDDSGEEFQQLIAWTDHPQALAAACWCDSGEPFGDCHRDVARALPCWCGSGRTNGECHDPQGV